MRSISRVIVVASIAVFCAACKKGGVDATSPTAPASPKNTNFTGTWTGTLTRPSGLGDISVRWVVTQNDFNLSGPLTLTYNGLTLDATMNGPFNSSAQSSGSSLGPMLIPRPAGAATLPACQMFPDNNPSAGTGLFFRGITPTSTTLTSQSFSIRYDNCRGFVDPDGTGSNHSETTQMTLTRQ